MKYIFTVIVLFGMSLMLIPMIGIIVGVLKSLFWWGRPGFDWAKSNGMDNTRQRLAKSKQP